MNFQETTLAAIVRSDYRYAAALEQFGLDFCCHGKRTLATACHEKKIDPVAIEAALHTAIETTQATVDYNSLSLTELANHIVQTHHYYIREVSEQISTWLDKVANRHGIYHPEMISTAKLFGELRADLLQHLVKEEQVLFPLMAQVEELAARGTADPALREQLLKGPIFVLEAEHDSAGEYLEVIRRLTNNYTPPEDACNTFRLSLAALKAFEEDLHLHVHLENNILFPRMAAMLNGVPATA